MKTIVCIKQVPDTTEVKLDPKTNTLIREGVASIINPDDKNALEEALRIKEQAGGTVIVITMGPPQAEFALREALAMGADEAILLSDRAFAGADTWATSLTLAAAIRIIGDYNLIFCGHQAIDGDTAQVGPEIAEHLNLPQVTYVQKIISVDKTRAVVERTLEDGYEVIEVVMPALLTAVKKLNVPRFPCAEGIMDAFDVKKIQNWGKEELRVNSQQLGLTGSPTQVNKVFSPPQKGTGQIYKGNIKEAVQDLVAKIALKHVL